MRPLLFALPIALVALAAVASSALACAPYAREAGFGLERGVAWAIVGHVTREVAGETGEPASVVIAVDRTLAGVSGGRELTIRQDDGCDGFWYRAGDRVIAAVPRYPSFVSDPAASDLLRPPYLDLTNYVVAVWVLDGERVAHEASQQFVPTVNGVSPSTAAELASLLIGIPDTATDEATAAGGGSSALLLAIVAAAAGTLILGTITRRGRHRGTDRVR
jgi:hypothetical protein